MVWPVYVFCIQCPSGFCSTIYNSDTNILIIFSTLIKTKIMNTKQLCKRATTKCTAAFIND